MAPSLTEPSSTIEYTSSRLLSPETPLSLATTPLPSPSTAEVLANWNVKIPRAERIERAYDV